MPSVSSMIGLITQLESPYVTVHQDRCQLVRNRNADCLRCATVCTSGCISFDGEQLAIDPEKCIGCGTCATVCPTCCLEAHHPNDAELVNRCLVSAQRLEGRVVVACGKFLERAAGRFDPDAVVRVECLGRVEESLLTELAARGMREVVLVHDACEACEHVTGRTMVDEVLETEAELLGAWKCEMPIRLAEKLPKACRAKEQGYDETKRAAFMQAKGEAGRVGAETGDYVLREAFHQEHPEKQPHARRSYQKVMEDGTLPHFIPDRRERLLDSLASLGKPEDVMISTRLWGHVIIDTDACESCRMCATFCPTGALRNFGEDDGSGEPFGVEHYPGDCVKCRCCSNICPAHAIEISEEVFAVDMLAGMTDRYTMRPQEVKRGGAHTIVELQKRFIPIPEVYER